MKLHKDMLLNNKKMINNYLIFNKIIKLLGVK